MRNKCPSAIALTAGLRICRQLGEQRFGVWPAMAGQHPRRDESLDHRFRRLVGRQLARRFDQSGLLHLAQRRGGFQSHVRTHRHVLGQLQESRERLGHLQSRQAANRQDMHPPQCHFTRQSLQPDFAHGRMFPAGQGRLNQLGHVQIVRVQLLAEQRCRLPRIEHHQRLCNRQAREPILVRLLQQLHERVDRHFQTGQPFRMSRGNGGGRLSLHFAFGTLKCLDPQGHEPGRKTSFDRRLQEQRILVHDRDCLDRHGGGGNQVCRCRQHDWRSRQGEQQPFGTYARVVVSGGTRWGEPWIVCPNSKGTSKPPRLHQDDHTTHGAQEAHPPPVGGHQVVRREPGASIIVSAAAMGLIFSTDSIVAWLNEVSRPSQNSNVPTHTSTQQGVGDRGGRGRPPTKAADRGREQHGKQCQPSQANQNLPHLPTQGRMDPDHHQITGQVSRTGAAPGSAARWPTCRSGSRRPTSASSSTDSNRHFLVPH